MSNESNKLEKEGKTFVIQPGGENELFYSNNAQEFRCIGHLRFDVDGCGKLWSMWNPHRAAQKYNRQPFMDERDALVNALRRRIFCKPNRISVALSEMGIPCIEESRRYYGFHVEHRGLQLLCADSPLRGRLQLYLLLFEEGGGGRMKCLCIRLEKELHRRLRIVVALKDTSIQDFVLRLIEEGIVAAEHELREDAAQ